MAHLPAIPISNRPPRSWRLMAERTDGTGRMVYDLSDDRAYLEEQAERRTTARTRFWVEPNPAASPQDA